MTEPDVEAYCNAFALIEATAEHREADAKLIISDASLDTMWALAKVATAVLLHHQVSTGREPTEITRQLRAKLLARTVN